MKEILTEQLEQLEQPEQTERPEQQQPGFDAVIPATVRYDPALRPNAKLLYGEIRAMASKKGYCWASNRYFARLYGLAEKTIGELIRELAKAGYLILEVVRQADTHQVLQRRLWVSGQLYEQKTRAEAKQAEACTPPPKNQGSSSEKPGDPPPKNPEDIIGMKNTSKKIPPLPPKGQGTQALAPQQALAQAGLPRQVTQAMEAWLLYKTERRETYKPQGLRALTARAREAAERYGGQAVAQVIQDAMASNYQGIPWDKLNRAGQGAADRQAKQAKQQVEEW